MRIPGNAASLLGAVYPPEAIRGLTPPQALALTRRVIEEYRGMEIAGIDADTRAHIATGVERWVGLYGEPQGYRQLAQGGSLGSQARESDARRVISSVMRVLSAEISSARLTELRSDVANG